MNPTVYNDDARFFELLERWVEGDFNRRDEQEMLALTRSDDFRREAWEGFLSAPETDHATLLRRLRERLAQKQPRPRVFTLRFFMAAAAALALLLVAVVFLPKLATPDAAPLAQEKSSGQAPDTVTGAGNLSDAEVPPVAATQPASGNTTLAKDRASDGPVTAGDVVAAEEAASSSTAAAPPAQPEALEADDAPAKIAEDKVVQELESAKKEAPTSQGTIPTNAYPSARNYPNTQSVPAGSAKKAPQRKRSAAPAMPQGGWDAFNDYLRRNARLTDAARNNNISGTVRLQLEVTPEGKAVNIKVLKSLGYGCDEAAEELVRNFNWEPGASPITVDIPFVR